MNKLLVAFVILTLPLLSFAKGVGYGNTKWGMNPSEVVAAQGNGAHLISPEKYKDNFRKVRIDNVSIGSGLYTVTFCSTALIVLSKRT